MAFQIQKKKKSILFLLNKYNIKLKDENICPLHHFVNMDNFHEIFEINSIPVNYINLLFSLSTLQTLVRGRNIYSKIPLYMIKNNFTKIKKKIK